MCKNKVFLISPRAKVAQIKTYPPVALCLIATLLEQELFQVKIFDGYNDANYLEHCLENLDSDVLYVGISVMCAELAETKRVSEKIKKHSKDMLIVWGGNHPTLYPESCLKEVYVDYVVHDEGAFTAVELANHLKTGKDVSTIKGLYYKDSQDSKEIRFTGKKSPEDEHPDKYPVISYDYIDNKEYFENNHFSKALEQHDSKKHRSACIFTGMGCSYSCLFCINSCLNRSYREISAEKVYSAMKFYNKKYNIDSFIFIDDNFSFNKEKLIKLCDLLEKNNENFYWLRLCTRGNYFTKDFINQELITRMVKNGARFLQVGVESGSKRIREDFYQKGITTEQIIYSAKITKNLPILVKYTTIIGAPDETIDDVFQTFHLLMKLKLINKNARYSIFHLMPQPGNKLFPTLMPHMNVTESISVDDFVKIFPGEESYYSEGKIKNKIDLQQFEIVKFYFNFFMSLALAGPDIVKNKLKIFPLIRDNRYITGGFLAFLRLLCFWILLRFKLRSTRFPLLFYFVAYVLRHPFKNLELCNDDGLAIQ
ncbi:MAG: B12-binding domain-containing radical SAM protein [Oligoflexia bacterium]|nr:B12-binding domain-containing radical SAM protein [Oligoflexia bacterium]